MRQLIKKQFQTVRLYPEPTPAATAAPVQEVPLEHHHDFGDVIEPALKRVALLLAVSFIGMYFVGTHGSLARVYIGSLPVSPTKSQAELERQVSAATKSYQIKFKHADGKVKNHGLAETGITVDPKKTAANAKQTLNDSVIRRMQFWRPIKIELVTTANKAKLHSFVTANATDVRVAPKDAGLAINGGSVEITPDATGDGSTVPNAKIAVAQAVANLRQEPLALKQAKLPAAIKVKDLKKSQAKAQSIINQPVTFSIARNSVTPEPADIAAWLELTPAPEAKTVDVSVNSGKVLDYINKIAGWYITPPRNRLVTTTNTGPVVLDAGANGVDVVNKDQAAATVAKDLLQNKGVNMPLPVQYAAAKTVEVPAYDRWIIVDITTKRMYAYEKTNLVRSFLISAGAPATPTVTGHFAVNRKYVSQDMSGDNADGSRYFQPAVPYVSYFYGAYAIHGNYWRPASWFGNINSSHGCVGTTVSDGAWIYDWAVIGTPVIVHS